MKGLLLKDWFVILKQCKYLLVVPCVFMVAAAVQVRDGGLFFALMGGLVLCMLPVTVMGFDEQSKWEQLAVTMPYTRRAMVLSKYLLALLGSLAACLLYLAVSAIVCLVQNTAFSFSTIWPAMAAIFILCGLYTSLSYPVLFKLGVEKGRLWFLIGIVVLFSIAGAAGSLVRPENRVAITEWFSRSPLSSLLLYGLPVLALALMALSACVAVRLYSRREF